MVKIGEITTPRIGQLENINTQNGLDSSVVVDFGQNVGKNTDELNVNTNQVPQNQPEAKRTVNELYNNIKSICDANGLNISEAKNNDFLCGISGKTEEELLNASQAEINQIVKKIQVAIDMIKADIFTIKEGKKKLTFELIVNYNKLANGKVPMGWDSVENFRKAQQRIRTTKNGKKDNAESLTERFHTMYGCDISKLTKEELAVKLEHYFAVYLKDQSGKEELSDFSKLLFNSTTKEYNHFRDALEYLVANNRHKGYDAILESFNTQEQRTNFSNKTSYEYVEKLNTKADKNGEIPSVEDATNMTAVVLKDKDVEHLKEYQQKSYDSALDFYNEENKTILDEIKNNPEIIKNIENKLANGEKLTEKEQKYLEVYAKDQHFHGDNAGQFIGVGNNSVISDVEKTDLLEIINTGAYNIGEKAGNSFYSEVIKQVIDYARKHEADLPENFATLVNEATNGNYNIVLEKGSENVKLNAPKIQKIEAMVKSEEKITGNFGVTPESRGAIDTTHLEETKKAITNPIVAIPPTSNFTIVDAIKLGDEAVKLYFSENRVKATREVFNSANKIQDKGIIEKAYQTYQECLSGKEQTEILMGNISGKYVRTLVKLTDKHALVKYCKNGNASSFYATFVIKQEIKEIEKENKKLAQ